MGALLEAGRDCAEVGKKMFAMMNIFVLKRIQRPHMLTSAMAMFPPLTPKPLLSFEKLLHIF